MRSTFLSSKHEAPEPPSGTLSTETWSRTMPLGHKWVHLKHSRVFLLWHCYFEIKHGNWTWGHGFSYYLVRVHDISRLWYVLNDVVCSVAVTQHLFVPRICSYMTDMQRYVCQSASSTMMLFANYLTLCVHDYMYTQLMHSVICIYFTLYLLLSPTYFLCFFLMFIQHLRMLFGWQ